MNCCKNCKYWNQLKKPHDHLGQCTNDNMKNNLDVWYMTDDYRVHQLFSHNLMINTIPGMSCAFIDVKFTQTKEFNAGC